MQIRPVVSIYHDCRRALANGKFPVKIRVYFAAEDDTKYKKTGVSLTVEDFETALSAKVPSRLRSAREKILNEEKLVNNIVEEHPFLTPNLFKSIVKGKTAGKKSTDQFPITMDVEKLFNHFISMYEASEQIGTMIMYQHAKDSVLAFGGKGLTIDKIDKAWLELYEKWAQKPRKRETEGYWRNGKLIKWGKKNIIPPCSLSTIGMYLRCVKHIYNEVVDTKRKILPIEAYPFSNKFNKDGYTIRGEETVKNVVKEDQRLQLAADDKLTFEEARDMKYWFFSYYCLGMNFTDMAYLEDENIFDEMIVYVRRKTMRTVKVVKPVKVPLQPEAKEILKELGTHSPYLFGIIDKTMSAKEQKYKIELWYKRVNKNMKKIAARNGIKADVDSYGARHAVGKQLIENGVHLQYIQEIYGHTSIKTTQAYTDGMNIDQLKGFSDLLKPKNVS